MIKTMSLTCAQCGATYQRSVNVPAGIQYSTPSFICAECAAPRLHPHQFYKPFDRYSAMRESRFAAGDDIVGFDSDEIGDGFQVETIRRPERRRPVPQWVTN